jgi:uncharacterized protein (UPF0262 family)
MPERAAAIALAAPGARVASLVLEGESLTRLSPELEADRAQAVADLLAENRFQPQRAGAAGPYRLRLAIVEGRLVFDIAGEGEAGEGEGEAKVPGVVLALGPFRRLIKDYQLLVDSHIHAVHEGQHARIQAIDMGRRGLHNEGAALLTERLAGKIAIDFATARRLFTLVCVLHQRI